MTTGVQFTGSLNANQPHRRFTWGWNPALHVIWHVMATSPRTGAPQLDWDVAVERANNNQCTYWITVKNLTPQAVTFAGRYAILS